MTVYQIAALFHVVDNRQLDLVLGPVLGGFSAESEVELPGDDLDTEISGGVIGFTAGLYFKLDRNLALGPGLQYSRMVASDVCFRRGRTTVCEDIDDDDDLALLLAHLGLKITF